MACRFDRVAIQILSKFALFLLLLGLSTDESFMKEQNANGTLFVGHLQQPSICA